MTRKRLPHQRAAPTVIEPDKDAVEIGDLYRKARLSLVESVHFAIACGQRLKAKRDSLPHGEWLPWLRDNAEVLGFRDRTTASRLMKAANDAPAHHFDETAAVTFSRHLWGHNDDVDDADVREDVDFDRLLRDERGHLTPRARAFIREVRAEQTASKKAVRNAREEALAGKQLALPQKKYGVIYADPEWRFEPWSQDSGVDRAADNHYPTSVAAAIAERDVPSIAADDSVLFLWATAPMIEAALSVMRAWGFTYKTQAVWDKEIPGTGYWLRNRHEILLIGTRGNVPAPAAGTQRSSVLRERRSQHSVKPVAAYEMIESYFPNVPRIELNARKARVGWASWGNEAPLDEAAP